jgi:D-tagatose-1,6-bisphosphate aldolase subunit GatZ/KbaZ
MTTDYLRALGKSKSKGRAKGMPSFCTANPLVIEACLEYFKDFSNIVIIEATANQVNQFGGYTGMRPADFRDMVYKIASKLNFPREKIILGGDHLGPLIWSDLCEAEAMENAKNLVKEYVESGFTKIHLDTSMKLADDSKEVDLSDDVIASRGVELYKVCKEAYAIRNSKEIKDNSQPVYIIGSEVPIPGGTQNNSDSPTVTKPASLAKTIEAYNRAFQVAELDDAFDDIIGVVVQPGVEFGDDEITVYNREKAADLVEYAYGLDGIVLEGHSTDYQTASALREMVEDGIAILKVGPALTFGLREGLMALEMVEKLLVPPKNWSNFSSTLEKAMTDNPSMWIKHYHGSEDELRVKRFYSLSDRCRYYLSDPKVEKAQKKLLDNMDKVKIPLGLFHQFMPKQYEKISKGELEYSSRSIVKDFIKTYIDDYSFACKSSADRGEKMYDIVTIGEILVEVLTNRIGQPFTESGYLRGPYPSGAPAIFIDQAALCGARTAIISKIGNDDFGKINMKRLIEDGVDTTQVICTKDNTTGTAFVTYFADGERQFIFHFSHAACGELAPENVNEEVIKKSRVLHIMGCSITGSPSMGEAIMKAVRIAAENNVKIAFDPNIRPELYHGRVADFYEEILGYCDFLLTGKNEISLLCPNIENPIDYLVGEKERIVVVKDGSKGASLYTKKIRLRAPVFPANQVDPTGAGDSFDGTFLALMCDGYFLEDCMLYAAAAGAKAVEKRGPMEGNISFEELKKFVSDNPNLKVEKF